MFGRQEIIRPKVGDVVIADIGETVYRRIRVSTIRGGMTFDGRVIDADNNLADMVQNLLVHQIAYIYPPSQSA